MATVVHTAVITVPDSELEGMNANEQMEHIIFTYLNIDWPGKGDMGQWDIQGSDFFLDR